MSKKQYGMLVVIVVIASFIGGVVSNSLFSGRPARAWRNPDKPVPETSAEQEKILGQVLTAEQEEALQVLGERLTAEEKQKLLDALEELPRKWKQAAQEDQHIYARGISLIGKNARPGILLSSLPAILFFDDDYHMRGGFMLGPGVQPNLLMWSKNGKAGIELSVNEDGQPFLAFGDNNGKVRALLRLAPNGHPSLKLFDQNSKVIWQAP